MTLRVLLIGSGRRIRNNFLPALTCLSQTHTICGLFSPTKANREAVCNKWNIDPVASLDDYSFEEIDFIIMSISPAAVPNVLKKIAGKCHNKILLIDTPVFMTLKNFKFAKLLNVFSKVLVAEDFIGFPQFNVMRSYVSSGVLGTLQSVELHQTGFEYHGLALLRSFFNLGKVQHIEKHNNALGDFTFAFRFNSLATATIVCPYNRFNGWIYIVGDKGSMLYDPEKLFDYSKDPGVKKLSYQRDSSDVVTFQVDGNDVSPSLQPAFFQKLKRLDIEDNSDFNTFKSCGLLQIIAAAGQEVIPNEYSLSEALYDSAMSNLFWRARTFPSWFSKIVLLSVKAGIKLITRH